MESKVIAVGRMEVIYTVEADPENEGMALVTYWDPNGKKIGEARTPYTIV